MANNWRWKVPCYHSIDDEEKQVFIDIHEIANDCIKQMKKKHPNYEVIIVDDHPLGQGHFN
jgi:hypothetical protein|tara:strand:- start:94 stop:276 length:183 start_codon:yes stop_codon:yes gene_type:complete